MKTEIKNWLINQKGELENIIYRAAEKYFDTFHKKVNFIYDLNQCEKEAFNLVKGKDLCYDRPSIGLSYSLWYLGRRINTSLAFTIEIVKDAVTNQKPIEILDLGAGTGAVQVALGLCLQAVSELGYTVPNSRIINIDISPFMLNYHRKYLWPIFTKSYSIANSIETEYNVNSWSNKHDIRLTNPIITASYLFDHKENQKEIANRFHRFVEKFKPERVILLTSNQSNKKLFLDSVSAKVSGQVYSNNAVISSFLFKGEMSKLGQFRKSKNRDFNTNFSERSPRWDEFSFYARMLVYTEYKLALDVAPKDKDIEDLDLYIPEIKVRKDIELNTQQQDAAKINNRPTVITGPAGCGKSLVITERIKNICEATQYSTHLNILLTTFNKGLMSYLAKWLENLLDKNCFSRKGNYFYFHGNENANISLMHFDILPTRIGNFTNNLEFEGGHKYYLTQSVHTVCQNIGVDIEKYKDILEASFLYEEYIRVIYGQQFENLEAYQTGTRQGRPFLLRHNSFKRELIWKVIMHYLEFLENRQPNRIESIFTRRHKLLKALKRGSFKNTFTHIFVDEFQDCTQADYQIFFGLLQNNNNLVIAGDFAQAVHLGNSASVPREDEIFQGKNRMGNWDTKKLEGSYRLPFRISECIRPLSERIRLDNENTDIITPYKGSPPGARPIVVFAHNTEVMVKKTLWIVWYYKLYKAVDIVAPFENKINILEKDEELSRGLNSKKRGISVTDTILKLKGLEKECILWSTRAKIKGTDEVFNYIYTILTRTSSLLIIALFPDSPNYVHEAINLMDRNKMIVWDEVTQNALYHEVRENVQL